MLYEACMNPTEVHGRCGVVSAIVVQGTKNLARTGRPGSLTPSRHHRHATCTRGRLCRLVGPASHAYGVHVQAEAACTCLASWAVACPSAARLVSGAMEARFPRMADHAVWRAACSSRGSKAGMTVAAAAGSDHFPHGDSDKMTA